MYMLLLRDAFIYRMEQTDEGKKYLKNCWRLEQTQPERGKLRKKFGKDGKKNG